MPFMTHFVSPRTGQLLEWLSLFGCRSFCSGFALSSKHLSEKFCVWQDIVAKSSLILVCLAQVIVIPLTYPQSSDNCRTEKKKSEVSPWILDWIYYLNIYSVKRLFLKTTFYICYRTDKVDIEFLAFKSLVDKTGDNFVY